MSTCELTDGGRLNKRNPHIGFFKHAPKTNSIFADKVLQGNFISPTDYKKELSLRHSAYAGTFHYGPKKYRGMNYDYKRIISDRLGIDSTNRSYTRKNYPEAEPGPLQHSPYLPVEKARAADLNLRRVVTSLVPLHSLSSLTTSTLHTSQSMVNFASADGLMIEKPLFAVETIGLGSNFSSFRNDWEGHTNPVVPSCIAKVDNTRSSPNLSTLVTSPTPPSLSHTGTPIPTVSTTTASSSIPSPSYMSLHPPASHTSLQTPAHQAMHIYIDQQNSRGDPYNLAPTSPEAITPDPFAPNIEHTPSLHPFEDPMLPSAPFFDVYSIYDDMHSDISRDVTTLPSHATNISTKATPHPLVVSTVPSRMTNSGEKRPLCPSDISATSVVLIGQKNAFRLMNLNAVDNGGDINNTSDTLGTTTGISRDNEHAVWTKQGEGVGAKTRRRSGTVTDVRANSAPSDAHPGPIGTLDKVEEMDESRGTDVEEDMNETMHQMSHRNMVIKANHRQEDEESSMTLDTPVTVASGHRYRRSRAHTQPIYPYLSTVIGIAGTSHIGPYTVTPRSSSSSSSSTSARSPHHVPAHSSIHSPIFYKGDETPGLNLQSLDTPDSPVPNDKMSTLTGILHASANASTATPPRHLSGLPTLVVDAINDPSVASVSAVSTPIPDAVSDTTLDTSSHPVPRVHHELSPFPTLAQSPFASPSSSPTFDSRTGQPWRSPNLALSSPFPPLSGIALNEEKQDNTTVDGIVNREEDDAEGPVGGEHDAGVFHNEEDSALDESHDTVSTYSQEPTAPDTATTDVPPSEEEDTSGENDMISHQDKSQIPHRICFPLPYRAPSPTVLENWIVSGYWGEQWMRRVRRYQDHQQVQEQEQQEQQQQQQQQEITTQPATISIIGQYSTLGTNDPGAESVLPSQTSQLPPSLPFPSLLRPNQPTDATPGTKRPGESPPPYTFSVTQLSQSASVSSFTSSPALSISAAGTKAETDSATGGLSPVFSLAPLAASPTGTLTDRASAETDTIVRALKPGVHVLPSNPSFDFSFDVMNDRANDDAPAGASPPTTTATSHPSLNNTVPGVDTWTRSPFPLKQFLEASISRSMGDLTKATGEASEEPEPAATASPDSAHPDKSIPCKYILPPSLNVLHGDINTKWNMANLLGDGGYAFVKLGTPATTASTSIPGSSSTPSTTPDSVPNEKDSYGSAPVGDGDKKENGTKDGKNTSELGSDNRKDMRNTQVAIKCIRKKYLHTEEEKHAVSREVSIQRSLPPHPHMVKLLEVWEDGPEEIEARLRKYNEEKEKEEKEKKASGNTNAPGGYRRPPFLTPGKPVSRIPFSGSLAATSARPDTHGNVYLVMEACEHGDLASFIRRTGIRRFSEPQVRLMADQLLDAIDFLHSRGIMHADIKPHNILLSLWERPDKADDDGNGSSRRGQSFRTGSLQPAATLASGGVLHSFIRSVKLCDFGNARRSRDARYYRITGDVSLVPWNSYTGTMGYAAPEILTRRPYSASADIWSCGIVLYELLAGYSPFFPYTDCVNTPVPFPASPWSDGSLTPEAKHFVSSLLQIDPAKRLSAHAARAHPWFSL